MQATEAGRQQKPALPFLSTPQPPSPRALRKRIDRLSRVGIDKSIASQVVEQAPQSTFERHLEQGLVAMTQAMKAVPQIRRPSFSLRNKQRKRDMQLMEAVMERMRPSLDQATTYPLPRVQPAALPTDRTAQLERGVAAGRSSTLPQEHTRASRASSNAATAASSAHGTSTPLSISQASSSVASSPHPQPYHHYHHHHQQHQQQQQTHHHQMHHAQHPHDHQPHHHHHHRAPHRHMAPRNQELVHGHHAVFSHQDVLVDRNEDGAEAHDAVPIAREIHHYQTVDDDMVEDMDEAADDDDDNDDDDDDGGVYGVDARRGECEKRSIVQAAEKEEEEEEECIYDTMPPPAPGVERPRTLYPPWVPTPSKHLRHATSSGDDASASMDTSADGRSEGGASHRCHHQQQHDLHQRRDLHSDADPHMAPCHAYSDSIVIHADAPLYSEEALAPFDPLTVHPSEDTRKKATAAKYCIKQDFFYMEKRRVARIFRERKLQEEMAKQGLGDVQKKRVAAALIAQESDYLRLCRVPTVPGDFSRLSPLGRGAFGEVSLVRNRENGFVYAMKSMKKMTVLQHEQAAHVKAERDILADADNEWVVRLFFALQDRSHLYFVMEFVPGGDLMSLLMNAGYFPESVARFYLAELVMAVSSVHALGFIHRDIKPDNVLIDATGHIKLTDFGLCTTFRFKHGSSYYNGTAEPLLREFETECTCSVICSCPEWAQAACARRRLIQEHHVRSMAHSLVGTPNYIAPEVFGRRGYNHCCDWWSLGVILYEMLVGYPPFIGSSPDHTKEKVVNWRTTLKIPQTAHFGLPAKDLIMRLCCDVPERLGTKNGVREIQEHPFFQGMSWDRSNEPPFIPELQSDDDVSYFTQATTRAPPPPSPEERAAHESREMQQMLEDNQYLFRHFNFRRFWTNPS